MKLSACGIDLAKAVFQVHGLDPHGKPCLLKQFQRVRVKLASHIRLEALENDMSMDFDTAGASMLMVDLIYKITRPLGVPPVLTALRDVNGFPNSGGRPFS